MAKIEQNGSCSPPLGTPKTTQDGCIAARSLSFAAIAGDSPDNAGTTPPQPGAGNRSQNIPGRSRWRSLGSRYDCGASGQVAERAWPADRSPLFGVS